MDVSTDNSECPAISVIIPARNEEAFLAACIAAVQAQHYPGTEVIVVDNGSADRTAEIAAAMGARVVSEPIPGLPRAREAGRHAARGEILVYLDADTTIPPGYLARLLPIFADSSILAASTAYRFPDGTRLMNAFIATHFAIYKGLHMLKLARFIFGGSFAVRQSAMELIGGFNINLEFYGEDTDLSKRLAQHGEIAFLDHLRSRTSARRYMRQGIVRTCLIYFINYLLMLLCNRTYIPPRRALMPQLRTSLLTLLFVSYFRKP